RRGCNRDFVVPRATGAWIRVDADRLETLDRVFGFPVLSMEPVLPGVRALEKSRGSLGQPVAHAALGHPKWGRTAFSPTEPGSSVCGLGLNVPSVPLGSSISAVFNCLDPLTPRHGLPFVIRRASLFHRRDDRVVTNHDRLRVVRI